MLSTGAYLTYRHPEPYLYGRPLWVKRSDWQRFFDNTMADRYGTSEPSLGQRAKPHGGPSDDAIKDMIRVVHAEGAKGRAIPKAVRAKPGFHDVEYKVIVALGTGMFPRVGRAGSKRGE
jgi:hypothetical protein